MNSGFVPANVRIHEDYTEEFDSDKLENILADSNFPQDYTAVLLGNPNISEYSRKLESYGSLDFDTVLVNDRDERLHDREWSVFDEVETFGYDGDPSRAAELTGVKHTVAEDEPLVLLTPSYNVPRTNAVASEILEHQGADDGYVLDFPDFPKMSVDNLTSFEELLRGTMLSIPGGVPFSETLNNIGKGNKTDDLFVTGERLFDYEFNSDTNDYLTLGVPVINERQRIRDEFAAERFKNWAGQSVKDKAKRFARPFSTNGLDY